MAAFLSTTEGVVAGIGVALALWVLGVICGVFYFRSRAGRRTSTEAFTDFEALDRTALKLTVDAAGTGGPGTGSGPGTGGPPAGRGDELTPESGDSFGRSICFASQRSAVWSPEPEVMQKRAAGVSSPGVEGGFGTTTKVAASGCWPSKKSSGRSSSTRTHSSARHTTSAKYSAKVGILEEEPSKDLDDLSNSNEEEASPRTQILLKRLERSYNSRKTCEMGTEIDRTLGTKTKHVQTEVLECLRVQQVAEFQE